MSSLVKTAEKLEGGVWIVLGYFFLTQPENLNHRNAPHGRTKLESKLTKLIRGKNAQISKRV